jgi:transposase
MAKGYRPVDRDQPFLLPPDMRQWLPADHVVWPVIEAVRRLDTGVFHARRRTGGAGAAGYDPDMMVTLLIWAYANGITSARRIERLCQQDVAFRVVCAGHVPGHVTVARFRQQFADTAADLFAQVLVQAPGFRHGPGRHRRPGRHEDRRGRVGGGEPDRAGAAEARARAALERARAREAARTERAAGDGKKKEPARRNVTDPDSRLMPVRGGGFIQGYNPQNVTSEDDLVLATRLTNTPNDVRWYEPMIAEAVLAAAMMAAAGGPGTGQVGLVLADAGYLSEHNLTCPGPDRLIATGKRRNLEKTAKDGTGAREGHAPSVAAMAARLATDDGIAAYRRRGHIGETFHGDLKHNMGIRRLSVRGMPRASGEWTFAAAVRNLRKAITSGHLTASSLAALAG